MAFHIRVESKRVDQYDDDHVLVVRDSGVLEVTKDGEQVMLYGVGWWTEVKPGIYEKPSGRVHTLR